MDEVKNTLSLVSSFVTQHRAASDIALNTGFSRLSQCIKGLCDDMKAIRDLLPTTQPMDIWVKMHWLSKKKEIMERTRALQTRKTDLLIVLQSITM